MTWQQVIEMPSLSQVSRARRMPFSAYRRIPRIGMTQVVELGAPTMIRTWDPQIRNLVLYPAELPGRTASDCSKLRGR